jgi:hypothetical protein
MSNPGVIILSKFMTSFPQKIVNIIKREKNIKFQIEDNIGECIHIHIDDLRLDLTIEEFHLFALSIKDVFFDYLDGFNLKIKKMDPSFIASMSKHMQYIESINIVNKKMTEMQVVEYINLKFGLFKIKPLKKALAVEYLQGRGNLFESYAQNGFSRIDNKKRLNEIAGSIKEFGYPHKDEYIVFFKGQNIIRDGQHRAAILFANNIQNIPVLEIEFKQGYDGYKIKTGMTFRLAQRAAFLLYLLTILFRRAVKVIKLNLS